jgi:hypothetical protein
VADEAAFTGSAANGDAGAGWGAAENGEAAAAGAGAGAVSNGLEPNTGGAGGSKPNPSDGSATWNGESILRRSGSFTGLPNSPLPVSAPSSTTVNGDSCRATAANGLAAAFPATSSTTAKGESWLFAG